MTLVIPQSRTLTSTESKLDQYAEMADKLGYSPRDLEQVRLLNLLAETHVPVYDTSEVSAYLTSIRPVHLVWVWRPLKPMPYDLDRPRNDGELDHRPYDKLVPFHILKRAVMLHERCGRLEFFASDWASAAGDPFLMVRFGQAREVIGQWDEPGFEGRPEIA